MESRFEDLKKRFFEELKVWNERKKEFKTLSGIELKNIYLPYDYDYCEKLSFPGLYPFTRGIYPTMYRGKMWTMRMFAGFGTPENTNKRFKYLLSCGQGGLSTAFDMPTLMGYDPDHPLSKGEVGKEGVSIASLEDMEKLFEAIPLDKITTSMTINATAIILLALYVALGEKNGIKPCLLGGTTQNDILKEFIAQKEWLCPPKPSMRIIRDMISYCSKEMPKWNTISISGYHIREAGATAVQELAFTIADGIAYVETGLNAGLCVDDFAGRLSFFFDLHNDFFEEIAKLRAGRRMWAKIMKERFGAKKERSWLLRTHCQTAGCSLTAQQPYNNVVRTTIQALAGVLGGTQSLHTNSLDETYALPSEEAVTIALRTQQIIAEESGVAGVIDPLGGSYFIESLTDEIEKRAFEYIKKIDELGGMVRAIELGFPQREIAESAYRYQKEIEEGKRIIVGINKYVDDKPVPIPILKIPEEVEKQQVERIKKLRKRRDNTKVEKALKEIKVSALNDENLMYPIIEAVKSYATLGEISDSLRQVFGTYREASII